MVQRCLQTRLIDVTEVHDDSSSRPVDARNAVDEHAVLWFFACGVYEGKNLRDMCLDVVEVIEWDVQALNVGDGFWWVGCPAHVQQVSVFWIDGVWKGGDVEACNDFDG